MGVLIDGRWTEGRLPQETGKGGEFLRAESIFRNRITRDGSSGYPAESGRYHLYVSLACPWAHRTLIMRALKGLESMISVSVTHWLMRENGWNFAEGEGVIADPVGNAKFMYEIYARADANYSGRVTVPVLWDNKTGKIVNNESSEIIRMFNTAFDQCGATPGDYYPEELRPEIDVLNERIYTTVNNGVYRAGFATTQEAYDEAVGELFATLDMLEERLTTRRYLCGGNLTLADIRLLPTLLRFDAVYVTHFKCNTRRIVDYPNLWAYTRDLVQRPAIWKTFNIDHIKRHYYMSHRHINVHGIVPAGPKIDFTAPHDRDRLGAE